MIVDTVDMMGRVPVTVLKAQGELDASSYQELIDVARQAYNEGTKHMVLDMSELTYMASSGLIALQSIAVMLRGEEPPDPEYGWSAFRAASHDRELGLQEHFKLVNPQPNVDRVLDLVGFKHYLAVFDDLEAAVASF
jgi:anti-anti-sigma regulatory factor